MKRIIFIVFVILLSTSSLAITIDGHAFLENQTDHSGIYVQFTRLPFNFFSTQTDVNGYFTVETVPGNYYISYVKSGYYSQQPYNDYAITESVTLPEITLLERPTTLQVPDMYGTIQAALDAAQAGDTVLVAPGIYQENLNMYVSNVTLASHFLTTEDRSYIDQTILDGNNLDRVLNYGGYGCRVTGFKISNGNVSGGTRPLGCGAGILVNGEAGLLIDHCVFSDNYAETDGIIYIDMYSMVDIEHCTFSKNDSLTNSIIAINEWAYVFIKNTIIWDEEALPTTIIGYADLIVEYSLIQGGFTGVGNFSIDPLFADPENRDFQITWENFPLEDGTKSPCIDAGYDFLPADPDGTVPDIGAFYFDQLGTGPSFEIAELFNNATDPDNDRLEVTCILGPGFSISSSNGLNSWIEGGFTQTWTVTSTAITATSDHSFNCAFDLLNDPESPFPEGDWIFVAAYDDGSQIHSDEDAIRFEAFSSIPGLYSITPTLPLTSTTLMVNSFLTNAATSTINGAGLYNNGDMINAETIITAPWGEDGTTITSTYSFARTPRNINEWLFYLIFDWSEFEYALAEPLPFQHILPGKPQNLLITVIDDQVYLSWDTVPNCTYKVYSSSDPEAPYWMWDFEAQVLTQTNWTGPVGNLKKFYIVRAETY